MSLAFGLLFSDRWQHLTNYDEYEIFNGRKATIEIYVTKQSHNISFGLFFDIDKLSLFIIFLMIPRFHRISNRARLLDFQIFHNCRYLVWKICWNCVILMPNTKPFKFQLIIITWCHSRWTKKIFIHSFYFNRNIFHRRGTMCFLL